MQSFVITSANCFLFCRDGVDENFKPLDRYNRVRQQRNLMHRDLSFLIYPWGDKDEIARFFGAEYDGKWRDTRVAAQGNFKIVFSEQGYPIFYYASDPDPVRVIKTVKNECKFFKEWGAIRKGLGSIYGPTEVKGWKFKKGQKYLRIACGTAGFYELEMLVPELFDRFGAVKGFDYSKFSFSDGTLHKAISEYLYNHEPIDLNASWDFTDEEKEAIAEEKRKELAERIERERELDKRKNTPGFCHRCGEEGAEYIPFLDEYLCRECFYDIMNSE